MWLARVGHQYERHQVGSFTSPEEAAMAYDKALLLLRGREGLTKISMHA
jgi:hypothetical protein